MNIRLKSPLIWAFFLFIFPFLIHGFEIKGVWITRWDLYSTEYIKEIIDSLEKANVKDAFVQVYGNGEAYYNSDIAPKKYKEFDPLKEFINYAHEKNIRVHAWINLLYMWDSREMTKNDMHVVNRYPTSVLVDNNGVSLLDYSSERIKRRNIEGVFVSPSSEFVSDYMMYIIEEIANSYPIDGIHLDYCRFPGKEFVYDKFIKNNFKKRFLISPNEIDFPINKRIFGNGINKIKEAYKIFPKEELNLLIKTIYITLKEINPNIQLSAAVIANVKRAEFDFYQNWWEWLIYNYVDFVVLMAYSPSLAILKKQMKEVNQKTALDHIVIGLATYNQSIYNVKTNYQMLSSLYPVMGFCLFSNKSIMDKKDYSFIGDNIYKNNEK